MSRKTLGWAGTGTGFSITFLLLFHFYFLSVSQPDKSEHEGSFPGREKSACSFIHQQISELISSELGLVGWGGKKMAAVLWNLGFLTKAPASILVLSLAGINAHWVSKERSRCAGFTVDFSVKKA